MKSPQLNDSLNNIVHCIVHGARQQWSVAGVIVKWEDIQIDLCPLLFQLKHTNDTHSSIYLGATAWISIELTNTACLAFTIYKDCKDVSTQFFNWYISHIYIQQFFTYKSLYLYTVKQAQVIYCPVYISNIRRRLFLMNAVNLDIQLWTCQIKNIHLRNAGGPDR